MAENNELNSDLFTPSGCLTMKALEGYMEGNLSGPGEMEVKAHLERCDFCADALEGLRLMNDQERFNNHIREINRNIAQRLRESHRKRPMTRRISDRTFYFSVAATVIVMVAITYLLFMTAQENETGITDVPVTEKQEYLPGESDDPEEKEISRNVAAPGPEKTPGEKGNEALNGKGSVPEQDEMAAGRMESTAGNAVFDEESLAVAEDLTAMDESSEKTEQKATAIEETVVPPVIVSAPAEVEEEDQGMPEPVREMAGTGAAEVPGEPTLTLNDLATAKRSKSEEGAVIYHVVEQMPQFPGGEEKMTEYLSDNLQYPSSAIESGIEGDVFISFIVTKKGKVKKAEVMQGIGGGCDQEALRVIRAMPDWAPGRQRGEPVDVMMVLPVQFRLD